MNEYRSVTIDRRAVEQYYSVVLSVMPVYDVFF